MDKPNKRMTRRRHYDEVSPSPPPPLRIALCIPFDFGDFPFLLQCFQSIQNQTRQPDLVVISFSRSGPPVQEVLTEVLDRLPPILASTSIVFAEEKQLAGHNRNIAAAIAQKYGADLLSFFDADDIAHPRRLELIEEAFQRRPHLMAVLHGYRTMLKTPVNDIRSLEWPTLKGGLYTNCFQVMKTESGRPVRLTTKESITDLDPAAADVQNGHITVRAGAWEQSPYNETLPIGEDSQFNAILCERYGPAAIGLLPDSLSYYLNGTSDVKGRATSLCLRPASEESSTSPE